MISYTDWLIDRAESYRVLAQFFLNPPDEGALDAVRLDFRLDSKETLEQISEDFDLLFSLSQGILQPLESLYASDINLTYADVNEFYAKAGLVIDDSYETPSDHISFELLFMSYLIENNKAEMEKIFLEQHLINWVPYYCDQISKEAKTVFYREIAEIVRDFLAAAYDEYEDDDHGTIF